MIPDMGGVLCTLLPFSLRRVNIYRYEGSVRTATSQNLRNIEDYRQKSADASLKHVTRTFITMSSVSGKPE